MVFDKVPLRQSLEEKLIPEVAMTCRSAAPASVWVDDLEVKLRDRTLRPRVEGEDVSQALARDMFEIYKTGVFPRTGGWFDALATTAKMTSPIILAGTVVN